MYRRYIAGSALFFLGIMWTIPITHFLIVSVLPVSLRDPEAWTTRIYYPAAIASVISYVFSLFSWILYSYSKRINGFYEAMAEFPRWFACLVAALCSNFFWLYFFVTTQVAPMQGNNGLPSISDSPPYDYLIPLMLINLALLFWLPSCFLSQRSLRNIPWLSYRVRSLIGLQ